MGSFADLDDDITNAFYKGLAKYEKYYTIIDNTDAYYTALLLNPKVKGDILLYELSDRNAGQQIIDSIREDIYQQYRCKSVDKNLSSSTYQSPTSLDNRDDPEARMLRRLTLIARKPAGSDIDEYFAIPRIHLNTSGDEDWLAKW